MEEVALPATSREQLHGAVKAAITTPLIRHVRVPRPRDAETREGALRPLQPNGPRPESCDAARALRPGDRGVRVAAVLLRLRLQPLASCESSLLTGKQRASANAADRWNRGIQRHVLSGARIHSCARRTQASNAFQGAIS